MQLIEEAGDSPDLRKARGAFFTPEALSRFVVDWAVRESTDLVLEPSAGDAAFLVQSVRRIQDLQNAEGAPSTPPTVDGIEIHEHSAKVAQSRVHSAGGIPRVIVSDFFAVEPTKKYTAVVGNPPYIRYQDFSGDARARSRAAALAGGVALSGLASSWAAFVVHSASFLLRGGRLGFVLPAELLSVNYAAPVRKFLFDKFRRVDLVLFTERVFPEAEADVVLLLADGYQEGPSWHATIVQARNADGLQSLSVPQRWSPLDPAEKWTPSLLVGDSFSTYSDLLVSGQFVGLNEWGDTTLGMVTGNNRYFALSDERVHSLGLPHEELIPLSPPGSGHLRGLAYNKRQREVHCREGAPVWLFRPGSSPSRAARKYIAAGETAGVHEAYKCRVRSPWWRVPLVRTADLFLTYMNADTPRITRNDAQVHHLNSVHGIFLNPDMRALGKRTLPIASLNSMTLLGAEMVGRAYGGGLLKLEPREADSLPLPAPSALLGVGDQLAEIRPAVAALLRSGRLLDAVSRVDEIVLTEALGFSPERVANLRSSRAMFASRRLARSHG
jgi:adenine-specific DNA methylase